MQAYFFYMLNPQTQLEWQDGRLVSFSTGIGKVDLSNHGQYWQAVLESIPAEGIDMNGLARQVQDKGFQGGLANLFYVVDLLMASGVLWVKVGDCQEPYATLVPGSVVFRLPEGPALSNQVLRLSRFAYQRVENGVHLLESPRALTSLKLQSVAARNLVNRFVEPLHLDQPTLDLEEVDKAFVQLLLGLNFLVEVQEDGSSEEETEKSYRYWEFHDLLFHARSRMGRHAYPCGATFPFLGKYAPEPAVKPIHYEAPAIPLEKPDMNWLMTHDFPLTSVIEFRRSVRNYGKQPISKVQLGEFLYRCARVREVFPIDESKGNHYEISSRPYPSGGGSYEFELYITVNECSGLERGIYHYHPEEHALRLVQDNPQYIDAILTDAWSSAAQTVRPQVLITYVPRFARLAWKYRGMGYAASLKNVGVLYQTMYLVATAMNLAPCGLGNGNAFLFAKAIGSDYFEESSVAEFMLGSMKSELR